jgi:hypothetical protein
MPVCLYAHLGKRARETTRWTKPSSTRHFADCSHTSVLMLLPVCASSFGLLSCFLRLVFALLSLSFLCMLSYFLCLVFMSLASRFRSFQRAFVLLCLRRAAVASLSGRRPRRLAVCFCFWVYLTILKSTLDLATLRRSAYSVSLAAHSLPKAQSSLGTQPQSRRIAFA